MRGLDAPAGPKPLRRGGGPRIHRKKMMLKKMDCRVKPGNDDEILRHALQKRLFRGIDRFRGADMHPDAVEAEAE